jgi:predicted nucleotidyltransferase
MVSSLPMIAAQVGADERSLRRAAARGVFRCSRPTPRALEFAPGELEYLRGHWGFLQDLIAGLRTEPNVRLAVLYGSRARGTEHADSDVDLLVDFRDDAGASVTRLGRRLQAQLGLDVDVARLSRVRDQAPLLVLQAIDEGRPLVDRADGWSSLKASRETVARAARRQMTRLRSEAADGLEQMLEGL